MNGYESSTRYVLVVLGALSIGGLIAWAVTAEVPVMKVSPQGRIEPHDKVHRIEPPAAGRVVQSHMNLDEMVKEGDLLIEFDTRTERLELAQSKATAEGLEKELAILRKQIANKNEELEASELVDQVQLRQAAVRRKELAPRRRLAKERAELAAKSPTGAMSDLEKLERMTEVDALKHTTKAQRLEVVRLRREQAVRHQVLTAQVLELKREELRIEAQLRELRAAIDRLEYLIGRRHYRAPATGRLVDAAEIAPGAFIADGQRLGTILAADAKVRVRSRFPKETVGLVRPGQPAQVKLDGYPWTIYGTVPARVTRVGTEPGQTATPEAIPGTVRVELDIEGPYDPRIRIEHGLTGSVEVEVARVSPLTLLMRAIGEWDFGEAGEDTPPVREFRAEEPAR